MWWPSRDLFIPQTLGWSPWQPLKKGPWTHHPKKRSWLKSQGYFKIQSNNSTKYSSILNNPLRFVHLTHMLFFTRQMFQNLKKHASLPVWWHSVWFLPSYRRKGPSKQRLNKNMTQIPSWTCEIMGSSPISWRHSTDVNHNPANKNTQHSFGSESTQDFSRSRSQEIWRDTGTFI